MRILASWPLATLLLGVAALMGINAATSPGETPVDAPPADAIATTACEAVPCQTAPAALAQNVGSDAPVALSDSKPVAQATGTNSTIHYGWSSVESTGPGTAQGWVHADTPAASATTGGNEAAACAKSCCKLGTPAGFATTNAVATNVAPAKDCAKACCKDADKPVSENTFEHVASQLGADVKSCPKSCCKAAEKVEAVVAANQTFADVASQLGGAASEGDEGAEDLSYQQPPANAWVPFETVAQSIAACEQACPAQACKTAECPADECKTRAPLAALGVSSQALVMTPHGPQVVSSQPMPCFVPPHAGAVAEFQVAANPNADRHIDIEVHAIESKQDKPFAAFGEKAALIEHLALLHQRVGELRGEAAAREETIELVRENAAMVAKLETVEEFHALMDGFIKKSMEVAEMKAEQKVQSVHAAYALQGNATLPEPVDPSQPTVVGRPLAWQHQEVLQLRRENQQLRVQLEAIRDQLNSLAIPKPTTQATAPAPTVY